MMKPSRPFPLRRILTVVVFVAVATLVLPAGARADKTDPQGNIAVLVKSRGPMTAETTSVIAAHGTRVTYVWPQIDALAMTVNAARLDELRADPRVALVEPDQQGSAPGSSAAGASQGNGGDGKDAPLIAVPLPTSADPIVTWNVDMADATGSGFDGTGVTVAVVDSGLPQNWEEFLPPGSVDTGHAAGFGAEGWGSFKAPVNAIRGTGGHIGLFPHGLAVSSLIAGFPSEAGPIGGVAPGARILPIRVLNQFNFGWFSWFTAGILYVGQLKADGALPGPVVINFSIQAGSNSAILASAIDYATSHGVVFVTIAGNFGPGPGSISFPGRRPQSITAGAVGWLREFCEPFCQAPWFFGNVPENDATQVYVAGFSGREADPPASPSLIDVLAPGSFVFGEWLFGPGFSEGHEVAFDAVDNFIFGTSFAAPHVAGIAAQMLQKNPGLDQAAVEGILRASALPIPPSFDLTTPVQFVPRWGANATGAGLARGAAAVAATPAASEPLP